MTNVFRMPLRLRSTKKEIKNYSEGISNIKPFLNLYDLTDTEYPTAINKNNYTLNRK